MRIVGDEFKAKTYLLTARIAAGNAGTLSPHRAAHGRRDCGTLVETTTHSAQ